MKVLIDGDGCPVIERAVRIACEYEVLVTLICDTAHYYDYPSIQMIMVGKGRDATDFELMKHVEKGDLVITQDYGLAAMVLTKGAQAIDQFGREFTNQNIDQLLFSRHMAKKIRNAGGRLKGPNKRTAADDFAFETMFETLILKNRTSH